MEKTGYPMNCPSTPQHSSQYPPPFYGFNTSTPHTLFPYSAQPVPPYYGWGGYSPFFPPQGSPYHYPRPPPATPIHHPPPPTPAHYPPPPTPTYHPPPPTPTHHPPPSDSEVEVVDLDSPPSNSQQPFLQFRLHEENNNEASRKSLKRKRRSSGEGCVFMVSEKKTKDLGSSTQNQDPIPSMEGDVRSGCGEGGEFLSCGLCKERVEARRGAERHLWYHLGKKRWECEECGEGVGDGEEHPHQSLHDTLPLFTPQLNILSLCCFPTLPTLPTPTTEPQPPPTKSQLQPQPPQLQLQPEPPQLENQLQPPQLEPQLQPHPQPQLQSQPQPQLQPQLQLQPQPTQTQCPPTQPPNKPVPGTKDKKMPRKRGRPARKLEEEAPTPAESHEEPEKQRNVFKQCVKTEPVDQGESLEMKTQKIYMIDAYSPAFKRKFYRHYAEATSRIASGKSVKCHLCAWNLSDICKTQIHGFFLHHVESHLKEPLYQCKTCGRFFQYQNPNSHIRQRHATLWAQRKTNSDFFFDFRSKYSDKMVNLLDECFPMLNGTKFECDTSRVKKELEPITKEERDDPLNIFSPHFCVKFRRHLEVLKRKFKSEPVVHCRKTPCTYTFPEAFSHFKNRIVLNHLESHLDTPNFQCRYCGKFTSTCSVRDHLRRHHSTLLTDVNTISHQGAMEHFHDFRVPREPEMANLLNECFPMGNEPQHQNDEPEHTKDHEVQDATNTKDHGERNALKVFSPQFCVKFRRHVEDLKTKFTNSPGNMVQCRKNSCTYLLPSNFVQSKNQKLLYHLESHLDTPNFQCRYCGKFTSTCSVRDHLRRHHSTLLTDVNTISHQGAMEHFHDFRIQREPEMTDLLDECFPMKKEPDHQCGSVLDGSEPQRNNYDERNVLVVFSPEFCVKFMRHLEELTRKFKSEPVVHCRKTPCSYVLPVTFRLCRNQTMLSHIESHLDTSNFQCKHCGRFVSTLVGHLKNHHKNIPTVKMSIRMAMGHFYDLRTEKEPQMMGLLDECFPMESSQLFSPLKYRKQSFSGISVSPTDTNSYQDNSDTHDEQWEQAPKLEVEEEWEKEGTVGEEKEEVQKGGDAADTQKEGLGGEACGGDGDGGTCEGGGGDEGDGGGEVDMGEEGEGSGGEVGWGEGQLMLTKEGKNNILITRHALDPHISYRWNKMNTRKDGITNYNCYDCARVKHKNQKNCTKTSVGIKLTAVAIKAHGTVLLDDPDKGHYCAGVSTQEFDDLRQTRLLKSKEKQNDEESTI